MNLAQIVESLRTEYHLLGTALVSQKPFGIKVNGEHEVYFDSTEADQLIIYTPLGKMAANGMPEKLLEANLFGLSTFGCVFAIDAASGQVMLFYRFEQEPDSYEKVREKLQQLVSVAACWNQMEGEA